MPRIRNNLRLILGDCFSVYEKLPKIDLIVTDPPYEISGEGAGSVNKVKKLSRSLSDLSKVRDITKGYNIEGFSRVVSYLQGGDVNVYFFFCNKKQIPEYIRVYVFEMKCKFEILSWHKRNALPTYSNKYLTDTEYILYFHKGRVKVHPQSYEDAQTYIVGLINHKDKKLYGHPSIKPLTIIEKLIRNSSEEGQIVFDPFMGSGTTGVACRNLKRKFIGVEISGEYFEIAKKRLAEVQ